MRAAPRHININHMKIYEIYPTVMSTCGNLEIWERIELQAVIQSARPL